MRDIWKIIEAAKLRGMMVHLKMFPGGHVTLALYDNKNQMKQYMYDSMNGDLSVIEEMVKKDFPLFVPTLPKLPTIPGFPKP